MTGTSTNPPTTEGNAPSIPATTTRTLAFLSFGLFTACEVEDDSPDATQQINEELLGTWYFDAMIVEDEEIPYDDHEECGKDYIEFNEDGAKKYGLSSPDMKADLRDDGSVSLR